MSANKKRNMGPRALRVMIITAMLVAMTVALDRIPGLSIKTPGWKIGFSFIPPMVAAILLGPLEGALVWGLADLIGALLFPFGPYHPGFTIVAALMGFLLGVFLNEKPFAFARSNFTWKKIRFFPNMLVPVVVNCLVLGLVVNTIWVAQLYGSKTYSGWFYYRLVEYAILVPVQLALLPAVLKLCELLKRTGIVSAARRGAAEKLKDISRNESVLGLERVSALLSLMGDPQEKVPVVHVAGTNGKGSFTAMLTSILREAGLKVGSFTSPAVEGLTDSFRINCEPIGDVRLEELLSGIGSMTRAAAEKAGSAPTEFEVMTAAAYELFNNEGCDIAVVECGLGGRGDSTNVIKAPLLSVITNVQLDHTARLGRSRAQIASHKAGIIKEGRPVLWGGGKGEAYEVIRAEAEAKHAPLYCTDLSRLTVGESSLEGTHITFSGFGELTLSLAGDYQPENAANVLTAVELLRSLGIKIEEAAVRSGLASARWPARFEPIQSDPPVVFDGAHNPDGVALAANSIKKVFKGGRAVLLMAVMADKEYAKYPDLVRECADTVFAVTPDNPRALPAEALASCMEEGGVPARAFAEFDKGVEEAYNYAKERSLPLVALGTLYMYSQFRSAFEKISK